MKEIVSTVTSKGQITIPVELRKYLDIREGDKLSFVIEDDGSVRVAPPRYQNIASLRGMAGTLERPLTWEEMIETAREDRAEQFSDPS